MKRRAAILTIAALLAGFAATLATAAPGGLAPVKGIVAADFIATDTEGRKQRFAAQRGKVVLLNFWATWCPPCRREMPAMEQLHRAYGERGLAVVAVSQDQAPLAAVRAFAAELGLSFPVWHDRDGLAGRLYGIPGVPVSYLIGRDGRIAYKVSGEYDWTSPEARAAVEALLAGPARQGDKR